MIELFEKMNVKPEERRLVLAVFLVFFLLLNGWWGWMVYSDYRNYSERAPDDMNTEWFSLRKQMETAEKDKEKFDHDIAQLEESKAEWEKFLKALGASGRSLPRFNAFRRVRNLKSYEKLFPENVRENPVNEESGFESFEKHEVRLRFETTPYDLMLFMRELASQQEMIRLSSFSLKPMPERKKLMGDMNIIASIPKQEDQDKPRKN